MKDAMPLFRRRGETSAFGSRSVSTDPNQTGNGGGNKNKDEGANDGNELKRLDTSSSDGGGENYDNNPQQQQRQGSGAGGGGGPPKRLHNGTFAGVSTSFAGADSIKGAANGPSSPLPRAAATGASSSLELMRKRPVNKTGVSGGGRGGGGGQDGAAFRIPEDEDDNAALQSFTDSEEEDSVLGPATGLSTTVVGGTADHDDTDDRTRAYMSPGSTSLGDSLGLSMQSLRTQPGDENAFAGGKLNVNTRGPSNNSAKDYNTDDEEEEENDEDNEENDDGDGDEQEFVFKVVVVGDYSTGKTSLVKRFVDVCESPDGLVMNRQDNQEEEDDDEDDDWEINYEAQVPTVGTDFFSCRISNVLPGVHVRLQFWDTAGLERYATVYSTTYSHASAVMCVFDVTGRRSLHNVADKYIMDVVKYAPDLLMEEILVVGNKMDLLLQKKSSDSKNDAGSVFDPSSASGSPGEVSVAGGGSAVNLDDVVSQDDVETILLNPYPGVHFVETSARSKLNVEKALKLLCLNVLSQKAPDAFSARSASRYGGREGREAFQMARGMLDMNTKHPFAFSKLPQTNTLAQACEAFAQKSTAAAGTKKKDKEMVQQNVKKGAAAGLTAAAAIQSPDPRRPTALPNAKKSAPAGKQAGAAKPTTNGASAKAQSQRDSNKKNASIRTGGNDDDDGDDAAFHDMEEEQEEDYESSTMRMNEFSPKENTCSPEELAAMQKKHQDPNGSLRAPSSASAPPKGKVDASVGLSCKAVGKSPATPAAAATGKTGPTAYDLDALIDAATSSASAANKAAMDAKGGPTMVNSTYDSQMKHEEAKAGSKGGGKGGHDDVADGLTAKQRASKNLDALLGKGGGKGKGAAKNGRDDGDMRSKFFRDREEDDDENNNNNNNGEEDNAGRNSGEDSNSDGDAFHRRIKDAFDEIHADAKRNVHHNPNFTDSSAASKAAKANASVAAAAAEKAKKKNAQQKGTKPANGKGKGKGKADGGACKCCTTM